MVKKKGRNITTPQDPKIRELRGKKLTMLRKRIWKCKYISQFCKDKERCKRIHISSASAMGKYENGLGDRALDDDHMKLIGKEAGIKLIYMSDQCDLDTFKAEIDRLTSDDPDEYWDDDSDDDWGNDSEKEVTKTVPTEKSGTFFIDKEDISDFAMDAALGGGIGIILNLSKRAIKSFRKNIQAAPVIIDHPAVPTDVQDEQVKLDDIGQKNIISEVDLEAQKKKNPDAST